MKSDQQPASTWRRLEPRPREEMVAARLQLHAAVQLPAAAATALLPAASDDSHTSLAWDPEDGTLWTAADSRGRRVGLALARLELRIASGPSRGGRLLDLPLAGRTLDEARSWLAGNLDLPEPPVMPCHDLPHSPSLSGEGFAQPGDSEASMAAWFHDAALALSALRGRRPGASPVRCWPHHFDMAILEPLEPSGGGSARSIGAGMTPGDATFPLPYFYVLPWPRPAAGALRPLAEGAWYTGAWTGALLPAGDLLDADTGEQQARVERFLEAATAAARTLLTADDEERS